MLASCLCWWCTHLLIQLHRCWRHTVHLWELQRTREQAWKNSETINSSSLADWLTPPIFHDHSSKLVFESWSLLSLQAVRSFQVAIHLCPSERTLWQEDLAWACKLQKQHVATEEKIRQEEEAKKQILHAPELEQDYDFESDEVLAACEAVAERQTRYEELKRTTVVIDAEGNIKNVVAGEGGSEDTEILPKEQFVKARGLWTGLSMTVPVAFFRTEWHSVWNHCECVKLWHEENILRRHHGNWLTLVTGCLQQNKRQLSFVVLCFPSL